jgi:hypothetical protein
MNAIVIEHVPIEQLPAEWQAKLATPANTHVTVRIEAETLTPEQQAAVRATVRTWLMFQAMYVAFAQAGLMMTVRVEVKTLC